MNLNDVAIPLILVNVSRFTEIVGIVFTEIVLKQPIKTKILKSKKFEEWKNEVPGVHEFLFANTKPKTRNWFFADKPK